MLNFGIDVSRGKLDCAVLDEQGQRVKRPRTFVNDHQGIWDLIRGALFCDRSEPQATPSVGAKDFLFRSLDELWYPKFLVVRLDVLNKFTKWWYFFTQDLQFLKIELGIIIISIC